MASKKPTPKPAATKPAPAGSGALTQYWTNPDDKAALRVWADALLEQGDPRGELVQLSLVEHPTDEHRQQRLALQKKHGGKLVGPAREFLREWSFGPDGLVEAARCEADKVVAGIDALGQINPRLVLTITSLKKKPVIEAFAKLALAPIYFVDFTSITGTHGGTQISDKTLATIAPAFKHVRHLALSCRGYADDCFTPAGLRALGEHTEALELLWIDHFVARGDANRPTLPNIDAYAEVIGASRGFATLEALHLPGAHRDAVGKLALASFNRSERAPTDPRAVEALKRS